MQQPLLILDSELRCVVANPAFCVWFGGKPDLHESVALDRLAGGAFATPEVQDGLRTVLHENMPRSGLTVQARETELDMHICPIVLKGDSALMVIFQPPASLPAIPPDDDIELLWALLSEGPYILFEMDGSGIVQRLSAGFERLTGWSPDSWLGRNGQALVHPDDVVRMFSPQIAMGNTWLNALRMITKSGDYRRFEVCTYPLIGPNGNVQRVFGIGRDMTEYFVLFDRRQDAESEARALFAAMDHIVVVASRDGHIMRVLSIPEGMLPWRGDQHEQIGGVKIEDVLSPIVSVQAIALIEAALTAGKPLRQEFAFDNGGKTNWFSAVFSPLDDQRVLIVAQDITERKQAEQQALELALTRERTGVLEQLIADVSHDLRSAISVLRSSTLLLDRHVRQLNQKADELYEHAATGRVGAMRSQALSFGQTVAEMREQVTRSDNSIQRIQSSVEMRLYEVRAEHGVGFAFSPQSLNVVIDQMSAIRRTDAARRGQSLALELDDSLPPVALDLGEFGRAIRTLIGRVMQDAPDNAFVTIRTRREDTSAVVEVFGPVSADPAALAKMANPAYRAEWLGDQWHSSHDLAIARYIVLAHGGKVAQQTLPGSVRVWQAWLPLSDTSGDGQGSQASGSG